MILEAFSNLKDSMKVGQETGISVKLLLCWWQRKKSWPENRKTERSRSLAEGPDPALCFCLGQILYWGSNFNGLGISVEIWTFLILGSYFRTTNNFILPTSGKTGCLFSRRGIKRSNSKPHLKSWRRQKSWNYLEKEIIWHEYAIFKPSLI